MQNFNKKKINSIKQLIEVVENVNRELQVDE